VSTGGSRRGAEEATVTAPAKLTLSLKVVGVRPDGYHLLDAEMVSIDLADTLTFEPGSGVAVVDHVVGELGIGDVDSGPANLVARALELVGRRAAVRLVKRIPVGAGLGGGSADAGAVLRWAGWPAPALAVSLGADVPFCVAGGRARVSGVGEVVEHLPDEDRSFVLLVPPVTVSTLAVYRAHDERADSGGVPSSTGEWENDLEDAAVACYPELAQWRDAFGQITGRRPRLAGSGSTWFVEGDPAALGIEDRRFVVLRNRRAPLVPVRTLRSAALG
jgi:4-diphosphocytidyl-2-C-methyl-D-erythritol kinase